MIERLINLVSQLGYWGYAIVFLGVMLESAAFMGFIVPGETLVLASGFLASRGVLDVRYLVAIVCVGAIVGDSIGYEIGHRWGRDRLLRHGRKVGITAERLERVEGFFHRHGGKAVVIGRFSAFLRAMTPFVAGASRMRYRIFLPYNVVGGLLWGAASVLAGYLLGESWRLVEHWVGRASAILAGIVVFIILVVALWRWLVHHEGPVRQWGRRQLQRPTIAAWHRRAAPVTRFFQARLTPGGYLGLSLTMGILIVIAAVWLWGWIAQAVLAGQPWTAGDARALVWLAEHASPPLTRAMAVVSWLSALRTVLALFALAMAIAIVRRDWYRVLTGILAVPGGILLNDLLLRNLFQRPRPPWHLAYTVPTTYGFPSGDAVAATLLYGFVAVSLLRSVVTHWKWRTLIDLTAMLVILLVGFSRVYLGDHYLSDVLGGYAAGIAWLVLCLIAVRTLEQARAQQAPEP